MIDCARDLGTDTLVAASDRSRIDEGGLRHTAAALAAQTPRQSSGTRDPSRRWQAGEGSGRQVIDRPRSLHANAPLAQHCVG